MTCVRRFFFRTKSSKIKSKSSTVFNKLSASELTLASRSVVNSFKVFMMVGSQASIPFLDDSWAVHRVTDEWLHRVLTTSPCLRNIVCRFGLHTAAASLWMFGVKWNGAQCALCLTTKDDHSSGRRLHGGRSSSCNGWFDPGQVTGSVKANWVQPHLTDRVTD